MQNLKRITISKMNLFNQKYHIQIHMLKLQHEKKKIERKRDSMEREILVNIYKF